MEMIDNNAQLNMSNELQETEQQTDAEGEPPVPNLLPNDPYFGNLWGLKRINATTVSNYTQGGKDVIVAVVDSGVDYNHPDLASNIWTNPNETDGDGIDNDGNGYIDDIHGWDFGDGDSNILPLYQQINSGHGTHVAGTIGAVGNNSLGIIGVSPNVTIMATKHTRVSDQDGLLWNLAYGMYYAINNGARILNLSFSSPFWNQDEYDVLEYAYERDVLVIASAGNDGKDNDITPRYPASYNLPNIITVAATDENDQLASFKYGASNYGKNSVDIAAPGVNIDSTLPNNQYATWEGTSMAVPHVVGAAALLLAANPNLTVLELRYALLSTVDKNDYLQDKVNSGGRLNALAAYQQVIGNTQTQTDSTNNTTSTTSEILIQAENYSSAKDLTDDDQDNKYRRDYSVDIQDSSDGRGFDVTGIQAGEWLSYIFNTTEDKFYNIEVRVASLENAQQIKATINGSQERIISFDSTGAHNVWMNAIAKGVSLTAGSHELRLDMLTAGFNLNYIKLVPTNTAYGSSNTDNISGSASNNSIYGGAGDDILAGGFGNDTIFGNEGNDNINGGDGNDRLYGDSENPVTGSAQDIIYGGQGNDVLFGGEDNDYLYGETGNDTLNGSSGNDSLNGGADNDSLNGGSGNDTLNGGSGNDTASYRYASTGINVNLATGTAIVGQGEIDTLISIETIVGSNYADVIIGNPGNNNLNGGAGNDRLNGEDGNDRLNGNAGNDMINGGDGTDTVTYQGATAGVNVNLATGTASDGLGGTDTLISIEAIVGSDYADVLTAGSGNNILDGGAGNDNLNAGSGNDTLKGSNGNDILNGGVGNDYLDGGKGYDTVSYINATTGVNVNLKTGIASDALGSTDTLVGIEAIAGSNFNDLLTGNNDNNVLTGSNGNDTLIGGIGQDTLKGGSGTDVFVLNFVSEGIDSITDFSRTDGDKILIKSRTFGVTNLNQFGYNPTTGALSFSNDGITRTHFATLNLNSGLIVNSDIMIEFPVI